ncbi:MAG TPA: NAD(P)H-dependent oxidoreductase, partial [Gammaproteobacteria bacterium]|nr:NAD(P)H-dependent oxidoreductase [Gammaproteobacteria bacterium]
MKVLIVYAHPEPQSFGGALLSTAVDVLSDAGHTVVVSDLYAKKFSAMAGPDDFTDRLDAGHLIMSAEQEHAATEKSFSSEIQGEIEAIRKIVWTGHRAEFFGIQVRDDNGMTGIA